MCSLCEEKCVSDFTKKNCINSAIRIRGQKERKSKRVTENETEKERERAFASITLRYDVMFMRAVTMMHKQ